jgi:hypothetical protein
MVNIHDGSFMYNICNLGEVAKGHIAILVIDRKDDPNLSEMWALILRHHDIIEGRIVLVRLGPDPRIQR